MTGAERDGHVLSGWLELGVAPSDDAVAANIRRLVARAFSLEPSDLLPRELGDFARREWRGSADSRKCGSWSDELAYKHIASGVLERGVLVEQGTITIQDATTKRSSELP